MFNQLSVSGLRLSSPQLYIAVFGHAAINRSSQIKRRKTNFGYFTRVLEIRDSINKIFGYSFDVHIFSVLGLLLV